MSFDVPAEAYGRFMGRFSEPLAAGFADFVQPATGDRALDVGCGTGALTAVLARRLGADRVAALDPSSSFVAAVRARIPEADVRQGVAEALPWPAASFELCAGQLVVHLMTDARAGLAEMVRVARPGGKIAAAVWDFAGGAAPASPFWRGARAVDPSAPDESELAGVAEGQLAALFGEAGLDRIESGAVIVEVTMGSFEEWWSPFTLGVGPAGDYFAGLDDEHRSAVRAACAREFPATGPFAVTSRAWAARGIRSG